VPLKVLIVSGIWPPDVGGPASHAPALARFLQERGHEVCAVTTTGPGGAERFDFPLRTVPRQMPLAARMPLGVLAVAAAARRVDVVYATGMYARSALVSTLYHVPLVLKLASDPAYERARRLGLYSGTLEAFQDPKRSRSIRLLKSLRRRTIRRASRVVIPSEYLAGLARSWGLGSERIVVIPNPAPRMDEFSSRKELRNRLDVRGPTFVFVGRVVRQKNLPLAIAALRRVPQASLVVVGEGPEQGALTDAVSSSRLQDRVAIKGALPRSSALEWIRAADAAILPSDWENFPHAAVEALAAGTPVIATSVGGVPEIVRSGVNGILVPPGDEQSLAAAMVSVATDSDLLRKLRDGAVATAGRYDPDRTFQAIERELETAAARG
jgi:glycosyltransferase involved in cell wall biosynthesis